MEKLIKPDGPVRFIGVSNFSPSQMEELLAVATIKPAVHQFESLPSSVQLPRLAPQTKYPRNRLCTTRKHISLLYDGGSPERRAPAADPSRHCRGRRGPKVFARAGCACVEPKTGRSRDSKSRARGTPQGKWKGGRVPADGR
jgi:hypothetical protein